MSSAQAVTLLGLTVLVLFMIAYAIDHVIPVRPASKRARQA